MPTERGIVIGTHFQVEYLHETHGVGTRGSPDYQVMFAAGGASNQVRNVGPAVRKALLYFDRIDWPAVSVETPTLPEVDVLVQQGFVQRHGIGISEQARGMGVGVVEMAHRWHFAQLAAASTDCVWAYAHIVEPLPSEYWPKPDGSDGSQTAAQ